MVRPRVDAMNPAWPRARTVLVLGRVSNVPTVWANIVAGWLLGGGGWWPELLWVLLGATFVYIAGMTLNDAWDARWDAEHAPERPIPSGQITRGQTWALGGLQLLAGVAVLLFAAHASKVFVLVLVLVILRYNMAHKGNPIAPWIMGTCRLMLYPVAASSAAAVGGDWRLLEGWPGLRLSSGPLSLAWVFGFALFAYVVALTFVARAERSPGRAASWPWLLLILPFAINALAGLWWAGLPLLAWVVFVWSLRRKAGIGIGRLVGLLLAGMVLVDVMSASAVDWRIGLSLALLLPVNLALQRLIPAT